MNWDRAVTLNPRKFKCGNCGENISSQIGYKHVRSSDFSIHICHNCDCPNTFFRGNQYPGAAFGNTVENVPDIIASLFIDIILSKSGEPLIRYRRGA